MEIPKSSTGVPCLPDGYCSREQARPPRPQWQRIAGFVAIYLALQTTYAYCAGTAVERFFLEALASRPAASLIGWVDPAVNAVAVGSRITAPGGGINISNGCEGTDIYFLLIAAFAVVAMPRRLRTIGLGLGLMLAFALNQARIIALFHAFRIDRAWFDLLHTSVTPVLLIVTVALYFHAWVRRCERSAT